MSEHFGKTFGNPSKISNKAVNTNTNADVSAQTAYWDVDMTSLLSKTQMLENGPNK